MIRQALVWFSIALASTAAAADNWPSWRGANYDGIAPGTGYATTWSASENIVWKIKLPGPGSSTPAIWGDQLFLTCAADGHNTAVCLDRSGKLVWKTPIGERARSGKNPKATGSNPSPVTDGQHVYVYFKSGHLACLDLGGKIVWETNLQDEYGEDSLQWDLGTSPVLTKDAVVVAVMHRPPSYLVAFEKGSGKVLWKQDRTLPAPAEANDSYSTPVLLDDEGRELLVVLGADHVTGHDAASGKELWRVGGLNPRQAGNFRSIASAAVESRIVIAPYARGNTLTGIKLGGSGDVTKSNVVWTRDDLGADVPTPAVQDGKAYICGDRGQVTCLDVKTGDTIWTGLTERHRMAYSASPVIADGKLYVTREDGTTFVLALGDEFKLLAKNEIGREQVVATPVFVDGRIYLRTRDNLYCIGK